MGLAAGGDFRCAPPPRPTTRTRASAPATQMPPAARAVRRRRRRPDARPRISAPLSTGGLSASFANSRRAEASSSDTVVLPLALAGRGREPRRTRGAARSAGSSESTRASAVRPRESRALTVPTGAPVSEATCSMLKSHRWCRTIAIRWASGSVRSAVTSAVRSGPGPGVWSAGGVRRTSSSQRRARRQRLTASRVATVRIHASGAPSARNSCRLSQARTNASWTTSCASP